MDDDLVPHEVTEYKLEIGKPVVTGSSSDGPGYGNKGDAGQRCANHPESHQVPWSLPPSHKERRIVMTPSGTPCYQHQYPEVG